MRINIDIPEADIGALGQLAEARSTSRATLIREAIAAFLPKGAAANEAFGLWRNRSPDGVEYQRHVRSEWES
jgi:predicted transcriptional regulator